MSPKAIHISNHYRGAIIFPIKGLGISKDGDLFFFSRCVT